MKKVILLILIVVLLVGCGEEQGRPKDVDFKKGFLNLKVNLEGEDKKYQDSPFNFKLIVENPLGYDVENVVVSLAGIDESYVDLYSNQEKIGFIEGRSKQFEKGGLEIVDFEGQVKSLPKGTINDIRNPYRIFIKYDSEFLLSGGVCIRSNLYTGADDSGCKSEENLLGNGENLLSGQGAPVGISKVVIPSGGQKVELRFTIANKGKNEGKAGTITLVESHLGGKPLNCEFKKAGTDKKQITFNPLVQEAVLVCFGERRSGSYSYNSPLIIRMLYDYELSIQKELLIAE